MSRVRVSIVPDKFASSGLRSLSDLDSSYVLASLPLADAMELEHPTDAHFTCYHAHDEDGAVLHARINKRSAAPREIREAGGDLETTCLALDWDNEGHAEWTDELMMGLMTRLGEAELPEPTMFYTTLHGARFVYELTRPVSVDRAELLLQGLKRDFWAQGILIDVKCLDWTRLFRLPRVIRDGSKFHLDEFFVLTTDGPKLDPDSVRPGEASDVDEYAALVPVNDALPDQSEVDEILWTIHPQNHQRIPTEYQKLARRMLRGKESYPFLFEHRSLASGDRNDSLIRWVGQVVKMMFGKEGTTPSSVYALFHDPVLQLGTEHHSTGEWVATTWSMVCRIWSSEEAQRVAAEERRRAAIEEAEEVQDVLLARARDQHPDDQDLMAPDQFANKTLRGRLIAAAPKGLYVMQRDGTYSPHAVTATRLHAAIKHMRMEELFNLDELVGKVYRRRKPQDVVDEHSINVARIECSPSSRHTHIRGTDEGRVLVLRVHELREDLVPERDEHVEHWLRLLFGDMWPDGRDWCSHVLDVGRAICALNVISAPGTGKGMLVQGLAECFKNPQFNDHRALGKFNSGLLDNPIISVDEGLPTFRDGQRPDEVIRTMVSGGNLAVEPKGRDIIHARIYPRIVLTANNLDVTREVAGRRDLSEADILALEIRMLTVQADGAAQRWLTSRGNYSFTRGWVAGDGFESRFRVARHILWMFRNRSATSRGTGRFLVEGRKNTRLMRDLCLRTPVSTETVRTVCQMLEQSQMPPGMGRDDDSGQVWTVPNAIVSFHRNQLSSDRHVVINVKTVGAVLRKISTGEPMNASRLPTDPNGPKQRWWELSLESLMFEALAAGYPRRRLEKLYLQRNGEDSLAMLLAAFEREERGPTVRTIE